MSSDAASTYSTGGGGVTLEHQYTATLLAALLVGDPAPELGDRVALTTVRLQASDVSAVDDLVLEGLDPAGETHRASIGVRRDPKLTTSDTKSVPLVRSYLEVVTDHWNEVSAGRWSLTLAVAKARPTFQQVSDLAALARAVPDAAAFAEAVARPAAMDAVTRGRLDHLRALVTDARDGNEALTAVGVDELVWRWLSALKLRVLRLEGVDTTDRATAVAALQRSVLDGTAASADVVFSRLGELAGWYATKGARVTTGMLRRELSAYPLKRLGTHEAAWRVFDRLSERLRDQTRSTITTATPLVQPPVQSSIQIDRADAASALRAAIERAATTRGALVITGEPDVGKSALTVRVCGEMRASGAALIAISLRDLPATALELEHALGGVSVDELLAGAATAPARVLVVDGCEAVLEGKEQVFLTLATAAARAGFGVAGVTRSDGSRYVRDAVDRALQAAGQTVGGQTVGSQSGGVAEHVVDELSNPEKVELADAVEVLARLHADPRAAWLLGRPGLVDALLRSDGALEPGQLLCEADVYAAVWNGLIRRRETNPTGTASPDDRAATVVTLARSRLGAASALNGQALRELRSDGVLRTEANPAFSEGPEFSTDLYRDFALCRLFLESGWQPLKDAGSPRWPIRAARLACQARLSTAPEGGRAGVWADLMSEFGDLAAVDGARWTEIPYEALLTLGNARAAIADLWDALIADDGLATLLRLADVRYAKGTIGDPYALAPIVEVAFCDNRLLGRRRRGAPRTQQEQVSELVLAWLRGVASEGRGPDPLRQRVRDTILEQDPPLYDAFAIEALATLGPDLDDRAEQWLRKVADERPSALYPVAEAPLTVVSMANDNPSLLLELSEAYYIEQPDERHGWHGSPLDDGIRDHRHGLKFGFGPPQAAWYYGPFFRLLNTSPLKAIAFINRMLNHAALYRVADHPRRDTDPTREDWDDHEGVTLELTAATGRRHFVGDFHVWCWYRGTSVGPYACMSALLALEKFTDDLYEGIKLPADAIADLLLKDCHNLAVPGMLAGFLIRHLDDAESLLDPYLADVDIWHLEFARATGEHSFRVRDSEADKLTEQDRRRFTPHEVVGHLVVNARVRGDEQRLAELERVGERLVESARTKVKANPSNTGVKDETVDTGETGGDVGISDDGAEFLAVARSWGAEFRIDSYGVTEVDDGVLVQFERPAEIAEALASHADHLETVQVLYGLQSRYALKNETPDEWPVDTLKEDIATAKTILDDGPPDGFMWPEDPLCAVAAAAIRAHVTGAIDLDVEDLKWAASVVLFAAENPRIDDMGIPSMMFHMGADRAAAIAVPLLLLGPCDQLDLDPALVESALRALATSMFDEVRMSFAMGCELVWVAPCDLDADGSCRRHAAAWAAVEHGLSDCVLGPWDNRTQRRLPAVLEPPHRETLPGVLGEDLLLNRLRMPVVCLTAAAHAACLVEVTGDLSGPLWDAHRRGLDHWWREGYDHLEQRHHEPVARVLIEAAMRGDRTVLDDHLRTFASNSHAMQMFMDSLAKVFTYVDRLRASLAAVWVPSLATVLDAVDAGADLRGDEDSWFDWAVASLVPTPQLETSDLDPDATLNRCRDSWADPNEFAGLFDRWAALAKGEPRAADTVAQLARTAPISWQASTGLNWLEVIIDGRHGEFSNRVWFVTSWLGELRRAGAVTGPVVAKFHRIVDGLAAGGDSAAVSLQLLDE